jgi:hypothetical protein
MGNRCTGDHNMSRQLSKRALLGKGALSVGVGLGPLALLAQRASADTPFTTFAFPATGAPTPRTMPDRLAEVINVRDFGAIGNGVSDDTAALQAAFNAAFGSSSSPHGTNSYLNKAVHIPNGNYRISSPLNLTNVMGGRIYGDGQGSTTLSGSGMSLFQINGMSQTVFEDFSAGMDGFSSTNGKAVFYLDWDGTGSVGLNNIMLFNIGVGNTYYGIRIAPSNRGGGNIVLLHLNSAATYRVVSIEGDSCEVSAPDGAIEVDGSSSIGFWVQKGSLQCGCQFSGTGTDIKHDSAGITMLYGSRSEDKNFINITNGKVVVIGFTFYSSGLGYGLNITSPATADFISCRFLSGGQFTGNGNVSLINTIFDTNPPIYLSSFTGTISNYIGPSIFTYAQLPPAAEGLMMNLSNSNTATWGANITGTGANRVVARWNGTNWTVVGK